MTHKEAKAIRKEIKKYTRQAARIFEVISIKAGQLEDGCPHLKTKTVDEYNEGGYLHRGSHIRKEICRLCGKEMSREETDTGYA